MNRIAWIQKNSSLLFWKNSSKNVTEGGRERQEPEHLNSSFNKSAISYFSENGPN